MAKKKTTEKTETPVKNEIEVSEIKVNTEDIIKSIENVDTNINIGENNTLEKIEEKIKEELKPLEGIKEKISEMNTNNVIEQSISQNTENAEAFLQNEIQKTEDLKKEIEKIIQKTETKRPKISSMTGWWNGVGYDI